jgi:serine/threonine-protein kinase SRPK3
MYGTGAIVGGFSPEYEVFKAVGTSDPTHPGAAHCLALKYHFIEKSSIGPHTCFVTDVLGADFESIVLSQPQNVLSVSVTKSITRQLLLALDYLHDKCGYVHTGIHHLSHIPENIWFRCRH